MYACIHRTDRPSPGRDAAVAAERRAAESPLLQLASAFAPRFEQPDEWTVLFAIGPLRRLIGSPRQVAAEIARRGAEMRIAANLGIASNPDAALLAACHLPGVTLIPPGQEAEYLGPIKLFSINLEPDLQQTLERWGLRTLADVAALPPIGLAERLGEAGVRLYELALGRGNRPLVLAKPSTLFSERLELEDAVGELDPLLFLVARLLTEICGRLRSEALATNRLQLDLELETRSTHRRVLELPVPQYELEPLLKLLRLDLEAHPPSAGITGIELALKPVPPRRTQSGLFLPLAPEPQKIEITLARLRQLVGQENVGAPELWNTHRPDAFALRPFMPRGEDHVASRFPAVKHSNNYESSLMTAMRLFRPPLTASVLLREERPWHVRASVVTGEVAEAAGPWRGSGDWWTGTAWGRDDWDVAIRDGGLFRLYLDHATRQWFLAGAYD